MDEVKPTGDVVRFGDFRFDMESHELFRAGERVPLQPQPGDLLALFLSRPGELIRREEIREHLWPGGVVSFDQRINSLVRTLRVALDDDRAEPRFIETVSRRGYRFLETIELHSEWRWRRPPARRALVGLAAVGAVVFVALRLSTAGTGATPAERPQPVVLAVLPVAAIGDSSSMEADALTAQLIASLGSLAPEHLGVIARTSAMRYEDSEVPLPAIAEDLGADYVLETTLRVRGDAVRVNASLVDPELERTLWTHGVDGTMVDLLAFEREVSRRIGDALQLEVLPRWAGVSTPSPTRAAAYTEYLKGRFLLERGEAGDARASHAFFRRAVAIDPGYAPAHVGLARSMIAAGGTHEQRMLALDRALRLDPSLGEAFGVRGVIRLYRDWDWVGAREDLTTAIALDPGRVEHRLQYSNLLASLGEFDEAIRQAELALLRDPMSRWAHSDLAWVYLAAGRYELALRHCSHTLDVIPDHDFAGTCLMLALQRTGRVDEAGVQALRMMEDGGAPEGEVARARAATGAARVAAFNRWMLDGLDAQGESPNDYMRGILLAQLGHRDEALDALRSALASRSSSLIFIGAEVRLASLRDDPAFVELERAVGIRR